MEEPEDIRLLREIRDLLKPIADAYKDQYDQREDERAKERLAKVRALVLASAKRKKAWDLSDGNLTQRAIASAAGMDEGNASRFFKALRELGAIGGELPRRMMEL